MLKIIITEKREDDSLYFTSELRGAHAVVVVSEKGDCEIIKNRFGPMGDISGSVGDVVNELYDDYKVAVGETK